MLHFLRLQPDAVHHSIEQFGELRKAMEQVVEVRPAVNKEYKQRKIGFRVVRPLIDAQQVEFSDQKEPTYVPKAEPVVEPMEPTTPPLTETAHIMPFLQAYPDTTPDPRNLPKFSNSF